MPDLFGKLTSLARRLGRSGFDVADYWESRYAAGGNSGDGSYGALAEFKAQVVNELIHEHDILSAIELGCGDGNQLSLINYPSYIGLDLSPSAVALCAERFAGDQTKRFLVYDPDTFAPSAAGLRADLGISLDVIYHIVPDDLFERYMIHLCDAAMRVLVIYSTNVDRAEEMHVRHRCFTQWMERNQPCFRLLQQIPNPFPGKGNQQSDAAFFCYVRVA